MTERRIGLGVSPNKDIAAATLVDDTLDLSNASSYGNKPTLALGIGGAKVDDGTGEKYVRLKFPKPSGCPNYDHIRYASSDKVSPIMDACESADIDIILVTENQWAKVSDVMSVLFEYKDLQSYGRLICYGPDWEWVKGDGEQAVKEPKIPGWRSELQGYRSDLKLGLISWVESRVDYSMSTDSMYLYDGQSVSSSQHQLNEFGVWNNYYDGFPRGYYWGYNSDYDWTKPLVDTNSELKTFLDERIELDTQDCALYMWCGDVYSETHTNWPNSPQYLTAHHVSSADGWVTGETSKTGTGDAWITGETTLPLTADGWVSGMFSLELEAGAYLTVPSSAAFSVARAQHYVTRHRHHRRRGLDESLQEFDRETMRLLHQYFSLKRGEPYD